MDSISDKAGAGADLKLARRQKSARADARLDVTRLPPHSPEAEAGVLGCCLSSPRECISECIEKITAEHFYDLRHATVFETLCAIQEENKPIDIISVQQSLKDKNLLEQIGGIAYLAQLQDSVPSAANLSYYLEIVREKFLLRKMIQICTEVVGRVYDYEGEVDALLDEVERDVLAIRPNQTVSSDIKTIMQEAVAKIEQKCTTDGLTGLTTGLVDLDKLTDGLHEGEMVVIKAKPSCGKTSLGVNIAVLHALRGVPVAILSAEMRPAQLVVRSLCSETRVNFHRLTLHDVPRLTVTASKMVNAPLYIEQASGFTIGQVKAICRRLHQKYAIRLILIDYLQRLTGTGDTMEQKTASVSKGVKDLCMELNVPIILLSQVNDGGQTKHAQATQEDTDSCWHLVNDGEWQSEVQPVKLIVEKCRDGETGTVDLVFCKTITRFEAATKHIADEDVPTK